MRKINFVNGEYYHIFNRGNNKRPIFKDRSDLERFFLGINEFNTKEPIGSIFENRIKKKYSKSSGGSTSKKSDKIVEFVCYCLNPNHFHFLLKQLVDGGVTNFMHRVGTGYTRYFNDKYKSSGALFQGRYKAIFIDSNAYLLNASVYVNLNYKLHNFGGSTSKTLFKSSWPEYVNEKFENIYPFCSKEIIVSQFKNLSEFKQFTEEAFASMKYKKDMEKLLLLEEEV